MRKNSAIISAQELSMFETAHKTSTVSNRSEHRTLAKVPLFAGLSLDDIRALDARCLWRRVGAGEWVIDYQAESADVYFVYSGQARVVIVSSGREMILRDIR